MLGSLLFLSLSKKICNDKDRSFDCERSILFCCFCFWELARYVNNSCFVDVFTEFLTCQKKGLPL